MITRTQKLTLRLSNCDITSDILHRVFSDHVASYLWAGYTRKSNYSWAFGLTDCQFDDLICYFALNL